MTDTRFLARITRMHPPTEPYWTVTVRCCACGTEVKCLNEEADGLWQCGRCSGGGMARKLNVRPISDLMSRDVGDGDSLRHFVALIDEGYCTPDCLFAKSDPLTCTCRCAGGCHGDARHEAMLGGGS